MKAVKVFEDVKDSENVAIMHQENGFAFVLFFVTSFTEWSDAKMSTATQERLAERIYDHCKLWKPEYIKLFFDKIENKEKWYPRPTAQLIMAELRKFEADKDDYHISQHTNKIIDDPAKMHKGDRIRRKTATSHLTKIANGVQEIKNRIK